ncbi:hypothetical protein HDU76_007748 [Blyttiomyces sp. JEL0837]|nr:hypothetical protein HDU76_007748 [Blyttiomyces sp. JEL0837]
MTTTNNCLHLILDFDGTITTTDTLAHIASKAAWCQHSQSTFSFPDGVSLPIPTIPFQAYLEDLASATPSPNESITATTISNDDEMAMMWLTGPEKASLERVSASGALKGMTKMDLADLGRSLALNISRDGWMEFVNRWNEIASATVDNLSKTSGLHGDEDIQKRWDRVLLCIASLNWSKDMVSACLNESRLDVPMDHLIMNDLEFELTTKETEMTTGRILQNVLTGNDKVERLKQFFTGREGCLKVYIGDSSSDIPCLRKWIQQHFN